MQEASFSGVIKFILWAFFIYYAIKFLARLFLPILAKKMVDKAQEQFKQQHKNQQNSNPVDANQQVKSDKPREKNKVGEYIDYEEVD